MALVISATRPWQVARSKLIRPRFTPSCRYESSSSSSSKQPPTSEQSSTSSAQQDEPRINFPWRHAAEPLKRVVAKDNLSGLPLKTQQQKSVLQQIVMAHMLGRDWYELFLPSVWKASLANDCAWAFQKGIAALLSKVFSVPIQDIDKEEFGIIYDSDALNAEEHKSDDANNGDSSKSDDAPDDAADQSQPTDNSSQCDSMLEANLVDFYKHVNPATTNVLLCMKPISSQIENIFSVSFTREMVQEDSSLAEIGRQMRRTAQVDRNPMEAAQMLKELEQKGKTISLFTIICDVSIQCLEAFAVKDKGTGAIVSGSTEPEEVSHLVRFEVVANMDGTTRLESWRIVDWDDMLNGNVWY